MAVIKICNVALALLQGIVVRLDAGDPSADPYPGCGGLVRDEFREAYRSIINNADLWRSSEVEPVTRLSRYCEESYLKAVGWESWDWLYQNCVYRVTGTHAAYTDEEKRLLVMEFCDKERQRFERLKAKFNSAASQEIKRDREKIPEEVRIAVWRRDQGKCVRCGGRENLEYDHIVPVSKGGSNTVRNVELLCESCNRQKGGRIQ
jgi:hypothetical protein